MRVVELINRENYTDVLDYLNYQKSIKQCCIDSIKRKWGYLRHFLEYACSTRFNEIDKIILTFPNYLEKARNDNKPIKLSPITIRRNLMEIQDFYKWAKLYKTSKYKKVSNIWLNTLKLSKARLNLAGLPDRKYFSMNEVIRLCKYQPSTLIEQRDQAGIALMYLSAIRISAFVSLHIRSVDLERMMIFQNPSEGVRTKNNKEMETVLLPIDFLVQILINWDKKIRSELEENSLWYPVLSTDGLRWVKNECIGDIESRNKSFRQGLKRLCNKVGVEYKSPHKLRRGHGVYAVKHAKNYEEFQAYSQNMGHEDPGTTFKYYSRLSKNDVREVILRNK